MAHPAYTRNWKARGIDPAYLAKFHRGNAETDTFSASLRQYHKERAEVWQAIADEESAK